MLSIVVWNPFKSSLYSVHIADLFFCVWLICPFGWYIIRPRGWSVNILTSSYLPIFWTFLFAVFGWSVHFMDQFSISFRDPSPLRHVFTNLMIRPFYGLGISFTSSVIRLLCGQVRILLMIRPLCGRLIVFLVLMVRPLCGGNFNNF